MTATRGDRVRGRGATATGARVEVVEELAGSPTAPTSAKHTKFREIGAKRVGRALAAVKVIGNLSNRNNYDFTQADVAKMTKALRQGIDDLEARFKPAGSDRNASTFSF